MQPIRFNARLKGGDAISCTAGYDRRLDYFFLVIGNQDLKVYSNLDQPDRMGLNLVRMYAILKEHLHMFSWPETLFLELDQQWRQSHGLTANIFAGQHAPYKPLPYFLFIGANGSYGIQLLGEQGGIAPLNELVRGFFRDISPNRVSSAYLHKDSPVYGYLLWCRDNAQSLLLNELAQKMFRYSLPLGGPICVAMHFDDRPFEEVWGRSEVMM